MKIFHILPRYAVRLVAVLAVVFLFIPNVVVLIFSFNNPAGRYNYTWQGFTLHAWTTICKPVGLCPSLLLSLNVGLCATVIATLMGTLLSYALVKYDMFGLRLFRQFLVIPLSTPDVVLAASLLALFVNIGFPLGYWAILIAHITFMLSYVVTSVQARLAGYQADIEQAAMDLYATPLVTFWKITLPNIAPGIATAAVLSFSLSFDDFIVTNFNAGITQTFPLFVWGSEGRGLPVQVDVVGSIVFVTTLIAVSVWGVWTISQQRHKYKKRATTEHHQYR